TPAIYPVKLAPGGARDRDFGLVGARISGTVFDDANSSGVRDAGEAGLANFRIYIDANKNGAFEANEINMRSSTTGRYSFDDLLSGKYVVRISPVAEFTSTTAASFTVTLAAGESVTRYFGLAS
ncbi:MAG TPA: SdrD B-like domain-containing protein, partial [Tepidisphaeraceae bacterium]|nr:SdrD B-like domain-containing protein [Tepidisphaeraceae bacterium]